MIRYMYNTKYIELWIETMPWIRPNFTVSIRHDHAIQQYPSSDIAIQDRHRSRYPIPGSDAVEVITTQEWDWDNDRCCTFTIFQTDTGYMYRYIPLEPAMVTFSGIRIDILECPVAIRYTDQVI